MRLTAVFHQAENKNPLLQALQIKNVWTYPENVLLLHSKNELAR